MITQPAPKPSRIVVRRFAGRAVATVSVAMAMLVLLPAAASADTPAAWDEAPDVSGLEFLVVLFLIPAGLFLVISLLAALPSMISDKGYEPGQTWRAEAEWFGGASKGVDAADEVTPGEIEAKDAERGGTSGAW